MYAAACWKQLWLSRHHRPRRGGKYPWCAAAPREGDVIILRIGTSPAAFSQSHFKYGPNCPLSEGSVGERDRWPGAGDAKGRTREWALGLSTPSSFAQLSAAFVLTQQRGVCCVITQVAE